MPRSYWMLVESPANYEISEKMGLTVCGLGRGFRRRAERMQPDDRMLFYLSGIRKWVASATVTSGCYIDDTPVWNPNRAQDVYPYRVKLNPTIILKRDDYIDAMVLGPRLEYVKRWVPEQWPLAFWDRLHLIPQRDFRLIEAEMKRIVSRGRRRSRGNTGRRRSGRRKGGSVWSPPSTAPDSSAGAQASAMLPSPTIIVPDQLSSPPATMEI